MTHFAVAVISDGTKTDDQLLAPYQENNMEDCPKEFLKFTEIEEEYREKYETEGCTYVFMPDGRRLLPWDEEFRKPGEIGFGSSTHVVPAYLEQREIPYKETWDSDPLWLNKDEWGSKERYAHVMSTFGFRAVVTPDGVWHEVGETGWSGVSHETTEEFVSWIMSFYDRFIAELDPDCTIAVYDCHI